MNQLTSNLLRVAGATLSYDVQGAGPVLLMIPGGPADAGVFTRLAAELAHRFTAVTYDPRGISRSSVECSPDDKHMVETLADDAHRVLAAMGDEPAFVLGNSGGAIVGLELSARYPAQVRTLVAHEPPCAALQPDGRFLEAIRNVVETYRRQGVGPGMQKFLAAVGVNGGRHGPERENRSGPDSTQAQAQMQKSAQFFLEHVILALAVYEPPFEALKAGPTRIIAAVGEASKGQVAHRGGVELARRLGKDVAMFPGGHGGFMTHPTEFADRLSSLLSEAS